jgi:dTMP kinase
MYVVLEGIDTAGKSTQIELLKSKYSNSNEVVFTKEPFNDMLRSLALSGSFESNEAEMFIFLADRAEHIKKVIQPNIESLIISDRSLISGIAYAKEFDIDTLVTLNRIAVGEFLPSKVFLLELTEEELKLRLSKKSLDAIELRGVEYLFEIQSKMVEACRVLSIDLIRLDATDSIESIHKKIVEVIDNGFK